MYHTSIVVVKFNAKWCIKQGVPEINVVITACFKGALDAQNSDRDPLLSSQLAGNESCSLGNVNVCAEATTLSCGGNKG